MDCHRWSNSENEELRRKDRRRVHRKDRRRLSSSQGSSPSKSIARIIVVWVRRKDHRWVCRKDRYRLSSLQDCRRVRRKDRRHLSTLQGSSPSPLQGSSLSESVARIVAIWVRRKELSLIEDDGSSQRSLQGSSQGLLLMELHRQRFKLHRWWLRSTATVGDQQQRWFGFRSLIVVWVFFFFLTTLSEMFWPFELKRPNGSESARYCN